jgi:uncharacterized protein YciI
MRRLLVPLVLLVLPLVAQEKQEMRTYVLAILEKGPKWTREATPEAKLQLQGHFENMGRLHREGKLILAGPLAEAGDAAGIFLLDTDKIEQAREWCETDPAIKGGRFQVRLWKWYSAKGIGILPQPK